MDQQAGESDSLKWFLIISHPVSGRERGRDVLDAHRDWVKEQHEKGVAIISGPTPDRSLALCLLRVSSMEEVEELVKSDPLHNSGISTPEIIEWQVHQILGAGF